MNIEGLNKAGLKRLIDSEAFKKLPDLPISTIRALSHIANPDTDDNDLLLYVAWKNEEIIAYRGAVPDSFVLGNETIKMAWQSTSWVRPDRRRRGIASQMLKYEQQHGQALRVATEFTPENLQVLLKRDYLTEIAPTPGRRLYYRAALQQLLYPKHKIFRLLSSLLQLTDSIINIIADTFRPGSKQPPLRTQHYQELPDEWLDWMVPLQQNELFARSKAQWRWMESFPWISATDEHQEAERYHFSVADAGFETGWWAMYHSNEEKAGLVRYMIRKGELKVHYLYTTDEHLENVMRSLDHIMLSRKLKYLTFYYPVPEAIIRKMHPLSHKKMQRRYLATAALIEKLPKGKWLQAGAGDVGFT